MKRINLLLLFIILVMPGCINIYFSRIPGEQLPQIPKELTGKYQSYNWEKKNGIMKSNSTGQLTVKSGSITYHDKKEEVYTLCDTLTFSEYKNFYFVSERAAPGYWTCYALQKTPTGFIGAPIILGFSKSDTSLALLKKYFPEIQYTPFYKDSTKVFYSPTNEDEIIQYFNKVSKLQGYTEFIRK